MYNNKLDMSKSCCTRKEPTLATTGLEKQLCASLLLFGVTV